MNYFTSGLYDFFFFCSVILNILNIISINVVRITIIFVLINQYYYVKYRLLDMAVIMLSFLK